MRIMHKKTDTANAMPAKMSISEFLEAQEQGRDIAVLLAALFGGALVGAGCAITFVAGGSTGGVDIISFTICKIYKKLKSSYVIFAIDATIVILGVFVIYKCTIVCNEIS